MVPIEKTYQFNDASGNILTLDDLFDGQDQLIIYHFMFDPDSEEVCRGCCHIGESLPDVRHLRLKNTNLVCISRAPAEKLLRFKERNGWTFPWYSSGGTDFNYDFYATLDDKVKPIELNFRSKQEMEEAGKKWYEGDVPGYSVFFKDKRGGKIYHTYSTFERGGEKFLPTLALLDMTPLGRQIGQNGPAEFMLKDEYGLGI